MSKFLKKHFFKVAAVLLMFYTFGAGLMTRVPHIAILNETIRNQYFHVPMWFVMIIFMAISVIYSIGYLTKFSPERDIKAVKYVEGGTIFGVLGLLSGAIWAKFTWGDYWNGDAKQNGALIALLIYFAYFVLRQSVQDPRKRAKISAVYNIFAFSALIPLLYILPSYTDSLHPGSGGNPGFNVYELDNEMRLVFYPAILGWGLLGAWIVSLRIRTARLKNFIENNL